MVTDLPNVAFKTPDNKTVLIVINTGKAAAKFNIGANSKAATASLNGGAVATFVW
jgi:glucosylceramidase